MTLLQPAHIEEGSFIFEGRSAEEKFHIMSVAVGSNKFVVASQGTNESRVAELVWRLNWIAQSPARPTNA